MANPEHVTVLKGGRISWRDWRRSNPKIKPDLTRVDLRQRNLNKMHLQGADLTGADLSECDLRKADLTASVIDEAVFVRANLCEVVAPQLMARRAVLDKADLTNANLLEINATGASFRRADLSGAKLRSADLYGSDMRGVDLRGVDLFGADLSSANLHGAVLRRAILSNTDLVGAILRDTDLRRCDLHKANLEAADLREAYLSGAVLKQAVLRDAILGWTTFGAVDLSDTIALESTRHEGPSTVGIDTIFLSRGIVPDLFLRGCGVPETVIAYARSLVTNPVEFYSCFISYSSVDHDFAHRLHADLTRLGVRCWFAAYDVRGGRKLHEQIDEAIRIHDRLLLILSSHSMNSEWVKSEIAKARKRELAERRQVLFPIAIVPYESIREWECFDADTGKDSAREIREYFVPDFSRWTNDQVYARALERLVTDLKSASEKEWSAAFKMKERQAARQNSSRTIPG